MTIQAWFTQWKEIPWNGVGRVRNFDNRAAQVFFWSFALITILQILYMMLLYLECKTAAYNKIKKFPALD